MCWLLRQSFYTCTISWIIICLVSILISYKSNGWLEDTYSIIPLSHSIPNKHCLLVPTNSSTLSQQTFLRKKIFTYVHSVRHHIQHEDLLGLTPYHLGINICLIVFKDKQKNFKTLYNPKIVGVSMYDYVDIIEKDILCPSKKSRRKKRYKELIIDYEDITDMYLKNGKGKLPIVLLREKFYGSDAIIIQNLLDTLQGKNLCNYT